VVENRGLAHAGRGGDLGHRRAGVAAVRKQAPGGGLDSPGTGGRGACAGGLAFHVEMLALTDRSVSLALQISRIVTWPDTAHRFS
jgi:hypothetical protein